MPACQESPVLFGKHVQVWGISDANIASPIDSAECEVAYVRLLCKQAMFGCLKTRVLSAPRLPVATGVPAALRAL